MSFETFWDNITSEFTEAIKEELAAQLQAISNRPSFLGEIKLLALNFGKISPVIELTDLVDPFPEFYRFEDTEQLPGGFSNQGGHPIYPGPGNLQDIGEEHSSTTNLDHYEEQYHLSPTSNNQHTINPNEISSSLRNLSSNSGGRLYQTGDGDLDVDSDQNSDELASGAYFSRDNHYYPRNFTMYSYPPSPPSLPSHTHQNLHSKHDEDVQAHLKVSYDGDMSLTIATSLNIDYPTKNFMSLPIVLKVTGFALEVKAVVAVLQTKVRFSLLPLEDPNAQILHVLKVESIIGEVNRHALRNVDRVESFILDKVRRILTEKLVFPNFITRHRTQSSN